MNSDLKPNIIFGAEQLGGHNWGDYDKNSIYDAIDCAIYHGIGQFDTADCYGAGESEKLLGEHISKRKNIVTIGTKFGVRIGNFGEVFYDSSSAWCKKALHASLKRLKVEAIDLYQMHYWDGVSDIEETLDTLEMIKKDGLIKNYGVCNVDAESIKKCKKIFSYSAEFSLLNDENEGKAKLATSLDRKFLPYGVLGQGILSGKYDEKSIFPDNDRRSMAKYKNFHGLGLKRSMSILSELRIVSEKSGFSTSQLSMLWASKYIKNSIPIVGIKSVDQIMEIVNAFQKNFHKEIIDDINKIYLKHNK